MEDERKKWTPEDWKKEDKKMQAVLRSMRAAYTYDCLKNKLPDACYNLADLLSGMDREHKKAFDLYEDMCLNYKHAHSCFKYGSYKLTGAISGIPKDEAAAIDALDFACKNSSNASACFQHAIAAQMGSDEKHMPDEKVFFQSMTRSCLLNNGPACSIVARGYYKGTSGAPCVDREKAVEFAKLACKQFELGGCQMAWNMYRDGDGIKADPQLARKYEVLFIGLRDYLKLAQS